MDKTKSISSSQAPSAVATQYVMMQYCVDMRLDRVWRRFLEFLLLQADHLPPNPFPYMVTFFRKGSMRYVCFFFVLESYFQTRKAPRTRVPKRAEMQVQIVQEHDFRYTYLCSEGSSRNHRFGFL